MSENHQSNDALSLPTTAPDREIGPLAEFRSEDKSVLTRMFSAYANPGSWGGWVQIAAHGGRVSYAIDYRAIGDTFVTAAVNYYGPNGWVRQIFHGSISFTTGNAWAAIHVCFHGNPLGSTVEGTVNP